MKLPSMWCVNRAKFLGKSIAFALCATVVAAGCSGGGSSGSGTPRGNEGVSVGGKDVHGDSFSDATVVRLGDGIVSSHINTPGDLDYFEFQLTGGSLYGLQFFGFKDQTITNPADNSLVYFIADGGGNDLDFQFGSFTAPDGTPDGQIKDAFLAPFTGKYYFLVAGLFANSVGSYTFRLTSSRLGVSVSRGDANTGDPVFGGSISNSRSHIFATHPDGETAFNGPTPFNSPVPTGTLTAIMDQGSSRFSGVTDGNTPPGFTLDAGLSTPSVTSFGLPVTFLNTSGVPEEDPETPVLHLHFGIPSHDLSDGIDDIDYSGGFPDDNFRLDQNLQAPDGSPHPTIAIINEGFELTNEFLHLIVCQDWYYDFHITNRLDIYSIPLISSFPQGGLRYFDSAFVLNGFETVPPTGSTRTLEVVYNDDYQVFYIPYDVDSALAGSDIHIHSGGPGQEGPILIDLGTVPPFATRPTFESARIGLPDFVPGVENIIKRLTNEESKRLQDATFSTGWYIDVHTEPFFVVKPEIRTDMNLSTNYEVASSLISFPDGRASEIGDLEPDGTINLLRNPKVDVTFASETAEFGPIEVILNGEVLGEISEISQADEIGCGEEIEGATVVGEILPGTYYYRAYADGVLWDGHVSVESGETCAVVVFDNATVQNDTVN